MAALVIMLVVGLVFALSLVVVARQADELAGSDEHQPPS